jgi:predicted enzyme related to lactoylglutathione lyase
MPDLITKLLPILHVKDPYAERDFYVQLLGLRATYEGPEYPDFLAVGNDAVEFGLSRKPDADPATAGLTWQLGVSDIDAVIEACNRARLTFQVTTERPRPDWSYRTVTVRSPNGMEVLLEEQLLKPA